ncbi:MAG: ATP synthase F1 subunit gamma [Clostridium sp.]|nr:ATP synthase F1 subunit gamma [Clostridium sp.]
MANAREIQTRMRSIKDTLKITNAMYLISSTKLRKAKSTLEDTQPYFTTMQRMLDKILSHIPEVRNQYFDPHRRKKPQERTKGLIVITADKGLAGAYNHNVLKLAHEQIDDPNWQGKCKLFVVGEAARHYFTALKYDIDEQFRYTSQKPTLHRARIISMVVLEQFERQELDEVYIVYTYMENSFNMIPTISQLLPLKDGQMGPDEMADELVMLPDSQALVDNIVPDVCRGYVFGALVESYCCEHNARMMAMDAAGKSARQIIKQLSLEYSRIRQGAITQEITEVVAGAKSQKKKRKAKEAARNAARNA